MGGSGLSAGIPRPNTWPVQLRPRPPFRKKGGLPMKFARTCGGIAAVCSVGIVLALACDHLAALLDAALMF